MMTVPGQEPAVLKKAPAWAWWALIAVSLGVGMVSGLLFPPSQPPAPTQTRTTQTEMATPEEIAAVRRQPTAVTPYDSLIESASQKHKVPVELIKSLIQRESGFDPQAVSPNRAKGLMKLMDDAATRYGVTHAFDPPQNIEAGVHYLSDLLKKYGGDRELALAAYNSGEDTVDKLRTGGTETFAQIAGQLPDETQTFVPAVMAAVEFYVAKGFAVTVRAQPDQWSEWVKIPPHHWARIVPEGLILMRLPDGRVVRNLPNEPLHLADEIRAGNFCFRSREEGREVPVTVLMRPK